MRDLRILSEYNKMIGDCDESIGENERLFEDGGSSN